MKFAEVIKSAGLKVKDFPNVSNVSISLCNSKGRKLNEFPTFENKLFSRCDSLNDFEDFLRSNEADKAVKLSNVIVRIHEDYIFIFSKLSPVFIGKRR